MHSLLTLIAGRVRNVPPQIWMLAGDVVSSVVIHPYHANPSAAPRIAARRQRIWHELALQILRDRRVHALLIGVPHEMMCVVDDRDLLVAHALCLEALHEIHRLAEAHVAVLIGVNQRHG